MNLRPYQAEAVEAVLETFRTGGRAALTVLPTGCGKTVIFSHAIHRTPGGHVMVIAHREELIFQAAKKIEAVTGEKPEIEMAQQHAHASIFNRSRVIVSSVQSLNAGRRGRLRLHKFKPDDFGLLVIDEAHHAVAQTYRNVIDHFRQNTALCVLGVTATPDRTDEEALGQIFEHVPYVYEIRDAIRDGWLVDIKQNSVTVEGLDLSAVRTTGGDLNSADLARVMEYEKTLHEVAYPTIERADGRKTLLFAASVAHAERLCEIFNRHKPGCARWVSGATPKDERQKTLEDYADGTFQFLCNVDCFTEGFDEPSIAVVAMARPTKSRAKFAQMVGRGTRPLPGIVEEVEDAADRRLLIASSDKPSVEIIDFVGNTGKHKLVTLADILGGKCSQAVIDRAAAKASAAGMPVNVLEELEEAEAEIAAEAEEAKRREIAQRHRVVAAARYKTQAIDPFDVLDINPWQEKGWDKGKALSEKQVAFLQRNGVAVEGLSFTQGHQLVGEIMRRRRDGLASYKQARILTRYGYSTDMSFEEASRTITAIAQNNWKRPAAPQEAGAA